MRDHGTLTAPADPLVAEIAALDSALRRRRARPLRASLRSAYQAAIADRRQRLARAGNGVPPRAS